jgi:hypothetical protein
MMHLPADDLCRSVTPSRVEALRSFGFTDGQARFLAHVLIFSGVFLERQYRTFSELAHGQKTHDFLTRLVSAGHATAITPGALHRGRFFHVQFKPFYESIGEADSRNRRPASLGRCIKRLMLLDAVLADRRVGWLGTERDKYAYFRQALVESKLPDRWYPHLAFGNGEDRTLRLFPDKLPIGAPLRYGGRHVFLYLVTRENPMAFRVFLIQHATLLRSIDAWTLRILVPRRFRKAASLYRYAVRDAYLHPLEANDVEPLDWLFRARRGEFVCPGRHLDFDLGRMARTYAAARFEALYRVWQQDGHEALWAMQTPFIKEQFQRGEARIEFAELPHQYLQLTPLVGGPSGVEKGSFQGDDLASL